MNSLHKLRMKYFRQSVAITVEASCYSNLISITKYTRHELRFIKNNWNKIVPVCLVDLACLVGPDLLYRPEEISYEIYYNRLNQWCKEIWNWILENHFKLLSLCILFFWKKCSKGTCNPGSPVFPLGPTNPGSPWKSIKNLSNRCPLSHILTISSIYLAYKTKRGISVEATLSTYKMLQNSLRLETTTLLRNSLPP